MQNVDNKDIFKVIKKYNVISYLLYFEISETYNINFIKPSVKHSLFIKVIKFTFHENCKMLIINNYFKVINDILKYCLVHILKILYYNII